MGKKTTQKLAATSKTTAVAAPKADSKSAPSSDDKKPNVMDTVEVLLHELEGLIATEPSSKHEEKERILQRLLHEYKQISMKNKVDSKREELLTQELMEIENKNDETQQEINILKENFQNADNKIAKLENLSQVLNYRIKTVETKAAEDIKEEKADRLKMSYEFSEKIKEISNKLDVLGKKREQIITENTRLKQILKQCLDDYDREQIAEKEQQARMVKELGEVIEVDEPAAVQPKEKIPAETASSVSTQKEEETAEKEGEGVTAVEKEKEVAVDKEPGNETQEVSEENRGKDEEPPQPPTAITMVMNAIMSGNPEDIAKALMNDKELLQLETQLRKEDHLMSIEDALSKLYQHRLQENYLREKVNTFMELFDQFQIRLTDSNQLFKIKQLKVEEITKDIKNYEKNNYEYNIRMNDCQQTTKVVSEQSMKIEIEKEKLLKIMEKQKTLIERFQNDVNKIEEIIVQRKSSTTTDKTIVEQEKEVAEKK